MRSNSSALLATSLVALSPLGMTTPAQASEIACGETYTVARGDTLSKISKRAYGSVVYQQLYLANLDVVGTDPNVIQIGQQLAVPCLGAAATETVQPAAETAQDTDAQPEDGPVVLTFNKTSAPPFIINTGIIDLYLAQVTEVTEGRVQFVDPDVMNRDQAGQLELVTSGAVDGAYVLNSNLDASHPLLQLSMLPLMGGSAEQTAVSLWRLHDEYLSDTDYFDDAQLLGFVAAPAAHIWRDASAPVTAEENIAAKNMYPIPYFKGLDVRGPAALREEVATWMTEYNSQNAMPPAFFLAHGAARALGIWTEEVQVTEVDYGVYTPTFSVILSNEAWARISPQDQEAILSVSGEALSARSASWDAFDNGFRSDMLAGGLRFEKADADLLAYLQEVSDGGLQRWTAEATALNIPAAEAIAFYRENLRALEDRLLFR